MCLYPDQDVRVLYNENDLADHQDDCELAERAVSLTGLGRIKGSADNGESDHDAEMESLAGPFENAVDTKSDIIQRDLEPVEPEEGEKSNVGTNGYNE